MPITVKNVTEALIQLGGRGSIEDIHSAVTALASPPLPKASRQVVRGRLQDHSRESKHYRQRGDFFRSVYGLADRRGIWELTPEGTLFAERDDTQTEGFNHSERRKSGNRNPAWSEDELTLALDLYVKTGGNPTAKDDAVLDALSSTLNKMYRLNGGSDSGGGTLRNRNGVYLKVMNFRRFDPTYLIEGKVGMRRGNRLEGGLWAKYEGRAAILANDAEAIMQAVIVADEAKVAKLPPVEPYEGEEGGVIMRLHKRYERDPKLVREKRKAAAAAGSLTCEVCGFDFEAMYGELGAGYIEVHHTKPVHTLQPASKTTLADLATLCANCHRMAHRTRSPLSMDDLRMAVQPREN